MFCVIPSVLLLLAASFMLRSICSSHNLIATQFFYLNIWIFFFNHPWKRIFRNLSLNNLENVLQRNLKTERARECIFSVFGGTNFENFSTQHQQWWCLCGFHVCTGQSKKLWIHHCDCNNSDEMSLFKCLRQSAEHLEYT